MITDVVYIKIDKNVEVKKRKILIEDIAKVYSNKKEITNKVKSLEVIQIESKVNKRYVFSILKIIELIGDSLAQVEVVNMGEMDFILTFNNEKKPNKLLEFGKIALVCLTTFFGAAFTIMTFNNDVDTMGIFKLVYKIVMGEMSKGPSVLDLSYSFGLTLGVVVFYNHFSKKKLSDDPTPIEIEMRVYEDDLNDALIKTSSREGSAIDVN